MASIPGWVTRVSKAKTVLAAGSLFILLMLVAAVAVAVRRYHAELNDAARELRAINLLLSEEADRSLQGVRLLLDSVADGIAAEGIDTAAGFAAREAGQAVHEDLKARVAGIPQIDALSLIGADGRLINSSRGWPAPAIGVEDRDYFRALAAADTKAPFIGEPVHNRASGQMTVLLARRLSAPDGTFVGLILGSIGLDYFDQLYGSLHLAPGDFIALWREDGTLLTRFPAEALSAHVDPATITPPEPAWRGIPGVFVSDQAFGGSEPQRRLIASTRTRDFPIQVMIGRKVADIIADWQREVASVGAAIALAAVSTAILLWALLRRLHALDAAAAAVRERAEAVLAREQSEAALRQSQKMEAIGQLTGGIAHDFNNMLAVIIGSLNLIQRRMAKDDPRIGRYLDAAMEGATRAASLTQRLLAFARQQPLSPVPVDADRLVEDLSQLLVRTLGETVQFETVPTPGLWLCTADPNQLENVILNLAVNARDAMPDGGRLTIATGNRSVDAGPQPGEPMAPGDYVVISVVDTGLGMTPEVMAKAFDPFFTTKSVGRGTGLGLSQALGFARQSGGSLVCSSEPGRGTTFQLFLPRFSGEGAAAQPHHPSRGPIRRGVPSEIVLVVEDEERVRSFSVEALRELGYTVVHAASGAEALGLIEAGHDVTLLFSDIVMPGMTGRQLAELATERRPGLKVLLTTGYAPDGQTQGTAAGGTPVIPKPFGIDQLALKLREVLDEAPA